MTTPKTIGPYQIVRPLAAGGMAQVFLAKKIREGGVEMTCVVKTILAAHAGNEDFVRMFLREARILASLRHQNIVQVLDFDRVDGTLYLAMEYVEGHDLRDVLLRARSGAGRPPLAVSLHIAMEALKGLDYAHRRAGSDGRPLNIVHRDLTSTNILLSREGEVKLVDFGIAKDAVSEDVTGVGMIKGKLHYLSPEQLEGHAGDSRADVFAMGVVLYEMATGRKPFDADTTAGLIAKILHAEYPPASAVAGAPKELDRLLALALAENPAHRFASAAAMFADLEKLAVKLGPFPANGLRDYFQELFKPSIVMAAKEDSVHFGDTEPLSASPALMLTPAVFRKARRSPWRTPAALLLALLVVGGIWAFVREKPRPPAAPGQTPPVVVAPARIEEPILEKAPDAPVPAPPIAAPMLTASKPPAESRPVPPVPKPPSKIIEPPPPQKPEPATPPPSPPPPQAPGYLRVGDLTPYAEVYVDGKLLDATPTKKISLPAGRHQVKLLNPKIPQTAVMTVEVVSEKTVVVSGWPK